MNYVELRFPLLTTDEVKDIVIAELADLGFESFAEEGDVLLAYVPEKDFDKERIDSAYFIHHVVGASVYTLKPIADQNWNALWESNYPPVMIADTCYIHAPFHQARSDARFNILLDPKMAFGTAHHETTAMMLELLLAENMKGQRVLDMGCGTGVLAILASMMGASDIVAIDNDEWAYRNTLENAEKNHISNIKVGLGDAALLENEAPFQTILANINKNILLRDIVYYAKVLVPGGPLFMSGFYQTDLEDIKNEAEKHGLKFVRHQEKNNWVAASFQKI